MNRKIKFRGISLDTGVWVYGQYYCLPSLRKDTSRHIIVHHSNENCCQTIHEPIDPNTLGEYIGLSDINNKEIYTGDIVKWGHLIGAEETVPRIAIVDINPDIQFKCVNLNTVFHYGNFAYQNTQETLEVLGSTFESKEILEG